MTMVTTMNNEMVRLAGWLVAAAVAVGTLG